MGRAAAWGGIIGPGAFIAAWAIGGLTTSRDYSPIDDAISRLAAVGADSRPLMTVGFITFGLGLGAYAIALRRALSGRAWVTAALTGTATLAVAALPLDHSSAVDRWHGVAAGIGYVTLAATPLLARRPLLDVGRHRLANAGLAAAIVSAISLALSLVVDANGLFQRLGLTATDLWIISSVPVVRSLLVAPNGLARSIGAAHPSSTSTRDRR